MVWIPKQILRQLFVKFLNLLVNIPLVLVLYLIFCGREDLFNNSEGTADAHLIFFQKNIKELIFSEQFHGIKSRLLVKISPSYCCGFEHP